MNKHISLALISVLSLSFSACGGGSGGDGDSTITHNGTTYGTVTSPYTGAV